MHYVIQKIARTKIAGDPVYVGVAFWGSEAARLMGQPAPLVNEFVMSLNPNAARAVVDRQGRQYSLDLGRWIDPDLMDPADQVLTSPYPAHEQILDNIKEYCRRATANQYVGDHTSRAGKRGPFWAKGALVRGAGRRNLKIETDNTVDWRGVLNDSRVLQLVGTVHDYP